MKHILIADDHAIVRSGLAHLLQKIGIAVSITEARCGEEVSEHIKSTAFDLVVMDINMPNTDSFSLVQFLLAKQPHLRILIFSMSPEHIFAKRYQKLGVYGYLSKDASDSEILRSVTQILLYNKPYVSEKLIETFFFDDKKPPRHSPFEFLSDRETEVMRHLVQGKSVSEISASLKLHTSTIGTHKARIFEKLHVTNIIELNKLAEAYHMELT